MALQARTVGYCIPAPDKARRPRLTGRDASPPIAISARGGHEPGGSEQSSHPEDVFIAELVAGVASWCANRAERQLAHVLAADLLDLNPELAYPWGALDVEAWLLTPVQLRPQRGVGRVRVALLRRELVRCLARTGKVLRRDARLMCRNVGEEATDGESIAA
jgi:hypothetical protein